MSQKKSYAAFTLPTLVVLLSIAPLYSAQASGYQPQHTLSLQKKCSSGAIFSTNPVSSFSVAQGKRCKNSLAVNYIFNGGDGFGTAAITDQCERQLDCELSTQSQAGGDKLSPFLATTADYSDFFATLAVGESYTGFFENTLSSGDSTCTGSSIAALPYNKGSIPFFVASQNSHQVKFCSILKYDYKTPNRALLVQKASYPHMSPTRISGFNLNGLQAAVISKKQNNLTVYSVDDKGFSRPRSATLLSPSGLDTLVDSGIAYMAVTSQEKNRLTLLMNGILAPENLVTVESDAPTQVKLFKIYDTIHIATYSSTSHRFETYKLLKNNALCKKLSTTLPESTVVAMNNDELFTITGSTFSRYNLKVIAQESHNDTVPVQTYTDFFTKATLEFMILISAGFVTYEEKCL